MISNEEAQKLKDKIRELEEENKRLKKIEKEKEAIEKQFEEFKTKHNITVENLKKAMKIKPNSKKKPKPVGAMKGHKGYTRVVPARIDVIKALNPVKCPQCSTKLGATQEIRSRHVTDIALVTKAKTTRYDIHRKYCRTCKKIVEPDVPNALPYARFGLGIMLLVMYLKLGLRLPYNKIEDFFKVMYDIHMSQGEMVHILKQLVVAFGDYYTHLEKLVKLARVKHTDTTSWRIDGKNYFAWVFVAAGITLYKIRKRNNHKVGLALFGRNQQDKVLVVDRFSALRTLAEKAGFKLQLCWSHILEDSKGLAKNFGANGKYVHRKLKEIYAMAKSLNHKGTAEQVESLMAEIFYLTLRHYKSSTVRKFVNNLYYRDGENLFRFVTDLEIDSTNNLSERELRALVVIRKISNGSRSTRGAHATAMLLSILQTVRRNNENVLEGLKNILNNSSGC